MKKKLTDFQTMSDKRMQKLEAQAISYATHQTNIISKILDPHRYASGEDIYGQNDLVAMWNDTAYNTAAWPAYKKPALMVQETNPITDFYMPLLQRMRTDYFQHAFHKHQYKTLPELKKIPQFDISKICKQHTSSFQSLQIEMPADIKDIAIKYGMDVFTPCLPEYTIKLSKNHILLIKVLDKNIDSDLYKYMFEDYLIDKQDIVCASQIIIQTQYDKQNNSLEWDAETYITYEQFLAQDIPDMNWSTQETNLWNDVFGIEYGDAFIEANCPLAFDAENRLFADRTNKTNQHIFLRNSATADYLQKQLRQLDLPELEIIGEGKIAEDKVLCQRIDRIYPKYLTLIALVNTELIKHKQNFIRPADATIIKVGNLSIRTQTPLRFNFDI